jgi:hypothetical protein
MVGLPPHGDATLPTLDGYKRAQDPGITKNLFGPIEHMIGKQHPSFAEKKRVVEDFANRVLAKI